MHYRAVKMSWRTPVFFGIFVLVNVESSFGTMSNSEVFLKPRPQNHGSEDSSLVGETWKRPTRSETENKPFYDYYYYDHEEPECPDGYYWHIRGLRCVPFDCPRGNQYRDKHTGECLLRNYAVPEESRERPFRVLRFKPATKFRLPFGLTLKG